MSRRARQHEALVSEPYPEVGGGVLLSAESRQLRHGLPSQAWVVLEEIHLEAVWENDRLTARTSARRIASLLGVNPGTVSAALRRLRALGLLQLERESATAGRFGVSVYIVRDTPGLWVIPPCVELPRVERPSVEDAKPDGPNTVLTATDVHDPGERGRESPSVETHALNGYDVHPLPVNSDACQEVLDLGRL